MHWFTKDWWQYLLEPRRDWREPWWRVIWCRWRGHPAGEIFYNAGGTEPDHHCSNCGDLI